MTEQERWRFNLACEWLSKHPVPSNNSTDLALWNDAWIVATKPPSEWPKLEIKDPNA